MKTSVALLILTVSGCAPSLGEAENLGEVDRPTHAQDRKPVAAHKPRIEKPRDLTKYLATRKHQVAATKVLAVDPRWRFSPRHALQPLGAVKLFYAVAPGDTGANEIRYAGHKRPRHFGRTVWRVTKPDRPKRRASLRVTCMRLVDSAKAAKPMAVPNPWPWMSQGVDYSKEDKIVSTLDVPICGQIVRMIHYRPHFQCIPPFLNYWNLSFTAGGWAVYINSGYHDGESAEEAALEAIFAADLVTRAVRRAQVGLDRPESASFRVEKVEWGNQEALCEFTLGPSAVKYIGVNVWSRVVKTPETTGYLGYATRVVRIDRGARTRGKLTTSTPWPEASNPARGRRKFIGFQFDWCDEFGIGKSLMHKLKH